MRTEISETEERIDSRTRKAAVESMTIVALGSGEYKVYSGTKNAYVVDVIRETCECPDEEYNHPADGCKHRQRVEMELGERAIPDLGRRTDVEIMSGRSREAETRVATDGGRAVAPEPQGASTEDTPARPLDCSCLPSFEDLPCWECYRAGYETPNPDAESDDGDDEVSG